MQKRVIAGWIAVAALFVSGAQVHADTYHRFWRGVKRADIGWSKFEQDLNHVFIPATVATGQGKGMIAYQPILTEGAGGLPDEVALVSYASKDGYDELYSTDEGKKYQNLHWQYFDRSLSHSVVPEQFTGAVVLEHAYDLDPGYTGWMANTTTVLVYFRHAGESPPEFAERARAHLAQASVADRAAGVLDRVTLVSLDYAIEYVSAAAALGAESGADRVIPVYGEAPEAARILPGEGVDLRF